MDYPENYKKNHHDLYNSLNYVHRLLKDKKTQSKNLKTIKYLAIKQPAHPAGKIRDNKTIPSVAC